MPGCAPQARIVAGSRSLAHPLGSHMESREALVATKIEVSGTFVQCGKYSKRSEGWQFVRWETALPSSLLVQSPSDIEQQLETARTSYRRFGQYSRALDQIRLCLEHRAFEKAELQRMCGELRIPSDFDI